MQACATCRCDMNVSPMREKGRCLHVRETRRCGLPATGGTRGKACAMASLAFHAGILALLGTFRPGAMPPGTPSEPEPAQVTAAAAPPEALAEPLPEPDWSALRPALLPQQPNEEETPQASELEDLATPPPASTEVTANPAAVAQFAKLRYAEAALASGTDAGDWANVKQRSSTAPAGGDGVASGGGGPGSGDGVGLGGDGRSGTGSGSGSGLGHGTGAGTGTAAAGKPAGLGGGPSRPAEPPGAPGACEARSISCRRARGWH
ncbi:MAG: hypothetical protein NTW87_34530 [Planctomycetota bacterium]|nr:hypothetical protein [Planctomycetota bacterium]